MPIRLSSELTITSRTPLKKAITLRPKSSVNCPPNNKRIRYSQLEASPPQGFLRPLRLNHLLKKLHIHVATGRLPTPQSTPRPGRSPGAGTPPAQRRPGG